MTAGIGILGTLLVVVLAVVVVGLAVAYVLVPLFKGIASRIDEAGLTNADRVMERGFLIAAHHGMTDEMLAHTHASFESFAAMF